MPSLQIRNLPDDLYQALSFRAERAHRSLAQQAIIELREATGTAASGRRRQILERIKLNLETQGIQTPIVPPEQLLREDRER
jgi:plasmid stability protein